MKAHLQLQCSVGSCMLGVIRYGERTVRSAAVSAAWDSQVRAGTPAVRRATQSGAWRDKRCVEETRRRLEGVSSAGLGALTFHVC